MKTAELTGALLDYWVARAESIPAEQLEIRGVPRTEQRIVVYKMEAPLGRAGEALEVLNYSTNWLQGGPLIEKYRPDFAQNVTGGWAARLFGYTSHGDTALAAFCRAAVYAVFGDEVEDLP